jgi:hypothetical protein
MKDFASHARWVKAGNTTELVAAAREACRNSMTNTAVGAWLAVVLERLESEHLNASGKVH